MRNVEIDEFFKDFCKKDYDEQIAKLKEIAARQCKKPIICMAEHGEFLRDIMVRWRLEEVEELKQIKFQND